MPEIRFDSYSSLDRDKWTLGAAPLDLRLRAAARIAWLSDHLRVEAAGHRRLTAALVKADAAAMLRDLALPGSLDAEVSLDEKRGTGRTQRHLGRHLQQRHRGQR
jgi:hypothetical protein